MDPTLPLDPGQPPEDEATAEEAAAPAAGTSRERELEQRFSGLSARYSRQQDELKLAKAELERYRTGQVSSDEVLKASQAEINAREATIAELKAQLARAELNSERAAKYPRAAQAVPDSLALLSEQDVATLEAQLAKAVEAVPGARPTPVPLNAPDSDGADLPNSREGLLDRLRATLVPN